MSLFSEEEINRAAINYSFSYHGEGDLADIEESSFKAGVKFTESKIAELAVEFFDWCMINDKVVCGFYGSPHTNDIDSKDLFQEFLKQRNNE